MHFSPVLALHILAGTSAIGFGTAAMLFRKGGNRHAWTGNAFVAALLTMAVCGVYMAVQKHQPTNVFGGAMTFYFVCTGWAAARSVNGRNGLLDWVLLLMGIAFVTCEAVYGIAALRSADGLKDGYPAPLYFTFGGIALLGVAGDIRLLARGAQGVWGRPRVVRHLWRICFAFFIATGSFFLGQQQTFPAAWRGAWIWYLPALAPLAMMLFWLVRVRMVKVYASRDNRPTPATPAPQVAA